MSNKLSPSTTSANRVASSDSDRPVCLAPFQNDPRDEPGQNRNRCYASKEPFVNSVVPEEADFPVHSWFTPVNQAVKQLARISPVQSAELKNAFILQEEGSGFRQCFGKWGCIEILLNLPPHWKGLGSPLDHNQIAAKPIFGIEPSTLYSDAHMTSDGNGRLILFQPFALGGFITNPNGDLPGQTATSSNNQNSIQSQRPLTQRTSVYPQGE